MVNILSNIVVQGNIARRILLIIGSLACLSFALAVQVPPPESYYITIYSHTPTPLWVAIGVALCLLPVTVALNTSHLMYAWGLFASIGSILIVMPWLVSYYLFLSGDAFIKVGAITSVLQTGYLQPNNFYPALHTIGAMASQITGVQPAIITLPLLLGFAAPTSLAGALLTSQFTSSKRGKYLGGILAPVLLIDPAYTNFSPWAQTTPILLFALFALVRKSRIPRTAHTIMVICFFFAAVIYHPLGSFVLLVIISIGMFVVNSVRLIGIRQELTNHRMVHSWMLAAVSFGAWASSFDTFLKSSARTTIINLLGAESLAGSGGIYSSGGGPSFIDQVLAQLQSASPQISDLFMLGLFKFGFDGLILLAAGVAIFQSWNWKRIHEMPQYYLLIVLPIPIFAGLGVASMFLSLPIGFARFIGIATLLSTITIAAESGRVLVGTPKKTIWRFSRIVIIAFVVFVVLLTPFSIYGSTFSKTPNMQVTEMEVDGAKWYLDHRADDSKVAARGMQVRRYSMLLEGHRGMVHDSNLPSHFGYNSEQSVWYNDSIHSEYLIITEQGRIAYPKLYPEYRDNWDFHPADFDRVQNDPQAVLAYTNGGTVVYYADNSTS